MRIPTALPFAAAAVTAALAFPPNAGRTTPPPELETRAAAVGAPAPTLEGLAPAIERGPAVVVFYRGHW